ncbi:recombinase family protein [Streptomyces sp. NBC_00249]|uniref:recombinase family protein n=1 Tax=Streptomyces sp. NBC_00249 TaxID=2975690 RepID=UPI00224E3A6A|nr:recombinase family protein [Streptomyces sp. NBC_00249]MCX5194749.1 recombinase family protein [Streptomyces sp. NBC_00249]
MSRIAEDGLIPVASYARTSQDSRQQDARGVRHQHRINERTAREHGCVVVATYTDNARNATRDDRERPGFDHLLADLHRGHAFAAGPLRGVVAVADDRLYRRPEDFIRFMAALTSEPGRVYVGRDGLRDPYSKAGLLQGAESLQGAVAEGEMRSRRVQDWHWSRAMDGLPHSGPRPFGWLEDRQTLHPMESELVRKAIEARLAGGSMGQVAREWAALGVTGTRGGRPNPQTVTQIITAPRVCGFRANRGELLIDPRTERPLVGVWQAIVPPEQWTAVCATFSAGSLFMHRGPLGPRLTDRKTGPKYLASGFLRCGARLAGGAGCDQFMGGSKSARSRKSPYNYICVSGRGCGRCAISGPLVEEAIERLLFPGGRHGRFRLPEPMRLRWQSGGMGFEEKRKVIASVFTHLVIKPGKKGFSGWDHSRVVPVWKWADRLKAAEPAA